MGCAGGRKMKTAIKSSARQACLSVFTVTEKLLSLALEKRARQTPIDRPIIVIGPERSGTSFVYSLLATHPDVYALTTAADRFPDHPLTASLMRRVASLGSSQNYRAVPKTNGEIRGGPFEVTEAVRYWARHLGTRNGPWKKAPDDFFTEEDLDGITHRNLPDDLKKRLFVLQKKRLVVKQPGFSLKIRYFDALFPDAIFVHCLRNPLDNFRSLMQLKEKSGDPYWGIQIPQPMRLRDASVEAETAQQLAVTYELILQSFRRIENGPARRVTVRYEAFQADFTRETRRLFQPCGLDAPLDVLAHPELFVISSSQPTKPRSVTNDPQALQILEKLCERMGYDFSDAPTDATANAT
ncbi:MAG TPA: sulfotransferase [Verrucomicrobiae bacterium]|nr:sulfotransferase [Verrucomicrobiae bacterium]